MKIVCTSKPDEGTRDEADTKTRRPQSPPLVVVTNDHGKQTVSKDGFGNLETI
jgi:hypothetical protein